MQEIVLTIVVYLAFTIIGAIIANKFKQPSIMGLLLMGFLIGPSMLHLTGDGNVTSLVIELGSVLLLFLIGLEFSLDKIKGIGSKALVIAVLKVGIILFFIFQVCLLLGFDTVTSLVIGVALAFSSTIVIVKVVEQKSLINRSEVPLLVAVLIVEDVLVVFFLAFFAKANGGSFLTMLQNSALSFAILGVIYWILTKFLGRIITFTLKNSSDDLTPFIGLGLCGAFSYLAYLLGQSPTIGAFLAGSVIASLPQSKNFHHATVPYTMLVTSLFFIAMGTLVNVHTVVNHIGLILILLIVAAFIRYVAISFITAIVANFRSEQASFFSVAMFSVGEFSLLVAQETASLTSIDVISIAAAIVFISSFMMIFVLPESARLSAFTEARLPRRFQRRLYHLSGTVKSLLEGLDTDSRASKVFKEKVTMTFVFMVGAFIASAIITKGIALLKLQTPFGQILMAIGLCFVLFLVYHGFRRFSEAMESLSIVYANMNSAKQLYQARSILQRIITAFAIILVTLFTPFFLYMLQFPGWMVVGAYIFLILGILMITSVVQKLDIGITYVPKKRYFREG